MRVRFKGVVVDIWDPYSARIGVKGEVESSVRGVRPKRHRRMMKCALERD